ncbi:MAG: tripartite tricarboxylate transporter substrate binding protein [Proteobacteria bacterium]|nr:tripartite tricarboxylate transporter substrate binding protein [Pseudomonadota bacterium]MCA0423437.1 tripartite tricarboxylate transporter substrate binding protein [Pseudomonadota bacterium]
MVSRRNIMALSLALLGAGSVAIPASAQPASYPNKLVKIVVPFAAGGGVDVFARLIAEKLRSANGYNIIVENRPGASGTIGGNAVRNAEADGYTLLFSAGTQVMAQQVLKSAPYNPIEDFSFIARVGEAPMMLVMTNERPQTTIPAIVADFKANPKNWNFGTAALGAPGHIATIQFNALAGVDIPIIAYPGTGPALNDVAGGHIQMLIDPLLALLPQARGGKVKAIAVTTSERTKLAPDIPTAAEAGMPGLVQSSWYGVWGPKALPADLVATLNKTMNAAVQELDKEGKLEKLGIVATSESPDAFRAFAADYLAKSAALLKAAKFEPQ